MGSDVWADDFTSQVYSEDFSGVSATGVTYSMTGTNNTVTMENGYLDFAVAARAGGTATATFTDSYFSNLAEYKFVCDLSFGYSNSESTSCSLTLNSDNAEGKMFTISYPGFGTATITAADGTTELATNIPTGRYALGTWVTFTLTVTTADGAHLTVSDGTTTYVNNVKIASAGHVTSISGSMGKSYSHFGIDNLELYKSATAVTVLKPVPAVSRVSGAKRYVTLSKDAKQEGTPTFYYCIGDENGEYIVYSSEIEVTSTSSVWYYAELSGIQSSKDHLDVTCEEVTLNAPTINVAYDVASGKYHAYFTSNQSDRELSPVPTYTYTTTSNSTPTAATSPVEVNVGETVTIYVDADGYTQASTSKATSALPFEIPSDINVWNDVFTNGETPTSGESFSVGSTSNLVSITSIGSTGLSGNVGLASYTSDRWNSTTNGIHPTNKYYLGVKGLTTGQYFKIVVPEQTMLYSGITGRSNISSSFYVENGDGTFTLYCLASAGSVCFNVTTDLYVRSIAAIGNVNITSAGWATLYTANALNFAGVDNLTAYTATLDEENSTVTLNEVDDVPANTGVVLKASEGGYYIPTAASSETEQGSLLGSATEATAFDEFSGFDLYMLKLNESNEAQFMKMTSGSLAAGKAYLKVSNSTNARAFRVVFAGETTGINSVAAEKDAEGIYNLSGQRVAQPTKGLYIVNGKKVIIK